MRTISATMAQRGNLARVITEISNIAWLDVFNTFNKLCVPDFCMSRLLDTYNIDW